MADFQSPDGIIVPRIDGDPASPVNGAKWYNTITNKFRVRENGANRDEDTTGGNKLNISAKSSTIITTGLKPGSFTTTNTGNWTKWTLTTDEANSTAVVNVRKNGTLIFTTNKPTLTAQKNNSGTNMVGTTTAYTIGDYFEIEIESNNNSKGLTITLE